jgi:mRNA-degrading endonuclease RelE of RelBE toxin-antitoxin system
MPWTVNETQKFQKAYSKANLQEAEERKYQEWKTRIATTEENPMEAVNALGYRCIKLEAADNQYEYYIGTANRISFTYDPANKTVDVVGVGHT